MDTGTGPPAWITLQPRWAAIPRKKRYVGPPPTLLHWNCQWIQWNGWQGGNYSTSQLYCDGDLGWGGSSRPTCSGIVLGFSKKQDSSLQAGYAVSSYPSCGLHILHHSQSSSHAYLLRPLILLWKSVHLYSVPPLAPHTSKPCSNNYILILTVSVFVHQIAPKVIPTILFSPIIIVIVVVWTAPSTRIRMIFKTIHL